MTQRYIFSRQQINEYFDRICMPTSRRIYDASSLSTGEQLSFLSLLQKYQLVKMPWENLTQHYSWHRVVNVKPAHLFKKMMENNRGGYCMEVNYLYHYMLLSLGFRVYMAGSRIYNPGQKMYGGWSHVVNIVSIDEKRYFLDGGFGPQGPTQPVLLDSGLISTQISPAQMRLMYEPIPDNLDQTQRVWIYQHRYDESSEWIPMYCFVDLEFLPRDIESMNFGPWKSPRSFFTHKVVCVRFTTDKESDDCVNGPGSPSEDALEGGIDGSLTINHDVLKWRRHGTKVIVQEFKNDQDRVEALRRYFGITLAEEDREAITGTAAMIGVRAMGNDD